MVIVKCVFTYNSFIISNSKLILSQKNKEKKIDKIIDIIKIKFFIEYIIKIVNYIYLFNFTKIKANLIFS